ncbi:unnamed protein product, partial [Prorocentrum cordatum]
RLAGHGPVSRRVPCHCGPPVGRRPPLRSSSHGAAPDVQEAYPLQHQGQQAAEGQDPRWQARIPAAEEKGGHRLPGRRPPHVAPPPGPRQGGRRHEVGRSDSGAAAGVAAQVRRLRQGAHRHPLPEAEGVPAPEEPREARQPCLRRLPLRLLRARPGHAGVPDRGAEVREAGARREDLPEQGPGHQEEEKERQVSGSLSVPLSLCSSSSLPLPLLPLSLHRASRWRADGEKCGRHR